jgi:hypothetical protein
MDQQEAILVSVQGQKAVIAVVGDKAAFAADIRDAIKAEEPYTRPVKHAFRLPDGTIGFEIVAGEQRDTFSGPASACQQDYGLWLCQSNTAAALSNDRSLAEKSLNDTSWQVRLGSKHLADLPIPLQGLIATGSESSAVIHAKTKTD